MADQTARQKARRAALDAQARARKERADKDRRLDAAGLEVAAALAERQEVVAECEAKAGAALARMAGEGLSLDAAVAWCGWDGLTKVEASRLLKDAGGAEPVAAGAGPGRGSAG